MRDLFGRDYEPDIDPKDARLMPCPFCGNDNPEIRRPDDYYVIWCDNDGCGISTPPKAYLRDVLAIWNRRSRPMLG